MTNSTVNVCMRIKTGLKSCERVKTNLFHEKENLVAASCDVVSNLLEVHLSKVHDRVSPFDDAKRICILTSANHHGKQSHCEPWFENDQCRAFILCSVEVEQIVKKKLMALIEFVPLNKNQKMRWYITTKICSLWLTLELALKNSRYAYDHFELSFYESDASYMLSKSVRKNWSVPSRLKDKTENQKDTMIHYYHNL